MVFMCHNCLQEGCVCGGGGVLVTWNTTRARINFWDSCELPCTFLGLSVVLFVLLTKKKLHAIHLKVTHLFEC